METTRRGLLKLGGILGAGAALPGCVRKTVLRPKEEGLEPLGREDFAQSVCGLCPAGCGIQVRRVDGRAVGVSGLADHPVNQGSLCPKGAALLQELYHPDRLKTPLARRGPRGRKEWAPISWDEAIRQIAGKLAAAGKPSFAAVRPAGAGTADGELLESLAKSVGGDCFALSFPQGEPPLEAYESMHGSRDIFCDPAGARLLVSFGFDWLQTHPSHVEAQRLWGRLRSRPGGARAHIVQVEPRFSVTAGKADAWIPVRPGTEGFLALGVAREMIASGRYDEAFIRKYSSGFEGLKKAVEPFTVSRVSEAAGVPEREIRLLAAKFLGARPAVAICQRGEPWAQMAVHALNAVSGSLGEETIFSRGEDISAPAAMDVKGASPEVLLFDRVNPLFLSPAPWKAALEKASFIVTVSPYLTETAGFSDIVLPCHTPLEQLHASRHRTLDGTTVLNAAGRGVEPLYETKDPGEIFLVIGRAAGAQGMAGDFASYLDGKLRQWGGGSLSLNPGEAQWKEERGTARRGLFATRSGRFEFDALTNAISRLEREPETPRDKDFPLFLYVYTPLPFSRGEGAHLPHLQSIAGVQTGEMWDTWAEIHPDTAGDRGIADGDRAWVRSGFGKIQVKARVLPSAMPGVVSVPIGLGHAACGRWAAGVGANPAALSKDVDKVFAGARVQMERV